MYRVLILLSTYNGEKYVEEQINSILSQEDVSISLVIRDDGSTDATCNIIDRFLCSHDNITFIKGDNLGFVGSFNELTKLALNYNDIDFFAYSDQDDIWLPQKMIISCKNLSRNNMDLPCLFFSNSMLIDKNGNSIGLFRRKVPRFTYGNMLLYGITQGCSMCFNRKAVELYNLYPPELSWHDRWMYFICAYFGKTEYCHTPLFKYRIHDNNAIASEKKKGISFARIKAKWEWLNDNQETNNHKIAKEFYNKFGDKIGRDKLKLMLRYINSTSSLYDKVLLLISPSFGPRLSTNWLNSSYHYVERVLFNKF